MKHLLGARHWAKSQEHEDEPWIGGRWGGSDLKGSVLTVHMGRKFGSRGWSRALGKGVMVAWLGGQLGLWTLRVWFPVLRGKVSS